MVLSGERVMVEQLGEGEVVEIRLSADMVTLFLSSQVKINANFP